MSNSQFYSKTHSHIGIFTWLLIFAVASSPLGYAQQPQQTPQQRILTQEDTKTNTDKPAPSAPRAARPELVLQTGVTRPAFKTAFSLDGRLLASMDYTAGSIKLWDIAAGRELYVINPGARGVYTSVLNSTFAFSSDGSSLFSLCDGTLKQWDTRSGRQLRSTNLSSDKDFDGAYFSADARLLAMKSISGSSLVVWDVGTGRRLSGLRIENGVDELFRAQSDPRTRSKIGKQGFSAYEDLLAFAFSPDGRILATNVKSSQNAPPGSPLFDKLTLSDTASGRVIQTINILEQKATGQMAIPGMMLIAAARSPRAIMFSPDGRAVALAFHDTTLDTSEDQPGDRMSFIYRMNKDRINKIRIWDLSGGRELISLDAGPQTSAPISLKAPKEA